MRSLYRNSLADVERLQGLHACCLLEVSLLQMAVSALHAISYFVPNASFTPMCHVPLAGGVSIKGHDTAAGHVQARC